MRIPVSRPSLNGNEERYVLDAVRSSWISSTGKYVDRFEREFADFCKVTSAVATSNGTTALHLALVTLGLQSKSAVIVPSLSFVATANAVRYTGATPVFVDVDPKTWCLDPAAVELALDVHDNVVGIIPVHLYGNVADMDAINRIALKHHLWVVEDAAEAHGARYFGKPVGSLGDLGTFSFYGNKILTCGEGGAVVDPHGLHSSRLRLLRGQGMDPRRRYYHSTLGFNYRLTNVACALLCAQLERFDDMIEERTRIFETYRTHLEALVTFQEVEVGCTLAPWLTAIVCTSREHRDAVIRSLDDEDIETRPFFEPIHTFPEYCIDLNLPVTERLSTCGLCLPTYPDLTDEELHKVIKRVLLA